MGSDTRGRKRKSGKAKAGGGRSREGINLDTGPRWCLCSIVTQAPKSQLFTILIFQRRLEGTKVTVESFMAWKAKFDAERLSNKEIVDVKEKRLTGKELFLQNISLNESDLQFITEGIQCLIF